MLSLTSKIWGKGGKGREGGEPSADLVAGKESARGFEPMHAVHLAPPFSSFVGNLPNRLADYPSMMSMEERRFLYGLASQYYAGAGLIIDAGIFLGGSTHCFGQGLRQNQRIRKVRLSFPKPIISFERGIVNPSMPAFFRRYDVDISQPPGEFFASFLQNAVKDVSDLADLRIGDIAETMKSVEDKVEILFLDVLKSRDLSKTVLSYFLPKLIPGRAIVIQQDYFFERLEFIKTDQEILSDYFLYIGEVASSAVFLCTKQIEPSQLIRIYGQTLPAAEQERLGAIAMQRSIDPTRRFLMAISKVCLLRRLYGPDAALEYMRIVRKDFPEQMASPSPRLVEAVEFGEKACRPNRGRGSG